jgi:hypothetical protein
MTTTVTVTNTAVQPGGVSVIVENCCNTFQFMSDTHVGHIGQYKLDYISGDTPITPDAVINVGDITAQSLNSEDEDAMDFLDGLGVDWYAICGGHDVMGRTPAQWAVAFGMPAQDYVVDLDHCRLIMMGVNDTSHHVMGTTELEFLEDSLSEAGDTPCIVVTHEPFYNTVTNVDLVHYYSSDQLNWYVGPYHDINTILGNYDNAKAMISGHVHCPYFSNGFFCTKTIGSHDMAFIHASSPYYTDKVLLQQATEPVVTVYVTISEYGVMQRVRDHYNEIWIDTNVLAF